MRPGPNLPLAKCEAESEAMPIMRPDQPKGFGPGFRLYPFLLITTSFIFLNQKTHFFIGILKRMIYYSISFYLQLSCCGVDNGRDFEFSRFNRDFTLQIFNQTLSISNLQTPLACCNSASRRTTFEPGACAKYPIRKDHTHYFEVRTPNI